MFIFQLMRSKVLLGLAVLSLLLAIGAAVLWIRSYSFYDAVFYSNIERTHHLFTLPGSIALTTWNHLPVDDFKWETEFVKIDEAKIRVYRDGREQIVDRWENPPGMKAGFWWNSGEFVLQRQDKPLFTQKHVHAAVPIWALTLLLLTGPAIWIGKLVQRYQRMKHGRCIYCNAVMPTPDRCPNCEAEFETWVF